MNLGKRRGLFHRIRQQSRMQYCRRIARLSSFLSASSQWLYTPSCFFSFSSFSSSVSSSFQRSWTNLVIFPSPTTKNRMCRSSHPEDDGEESVLNVVLHFFRKKFKVCARIACDECSRDWKRKNSACAFVVRVNTFNLQRRDTGRKESLYERSHPNVPSCSGFSHAKTTRGIYQF